MTMTVQLQTLLQNGFSWFFCSHVSELSNRHSWKALRVIQVKKSLKVTGTSVCWMSIASCNSASHFIMNFFMSNMLKYSSKLRIYIYIMWVHHHQYLSIKFIVIVQVSVAASCHWRYTSVWIFQRCSSRQRSLKSSLGTSLADGNRSLSTCRSSSWNSYLSKPCFRIQGVDL